ncbi:carbon-monoxide dehydrogenase large subunit [Rhodoligotrophos appendicifer]|uniref:xanthine dehydrogenase family protein molybdopterin-binding subunit n=1 Tax=Rhodoligotrophos appendicifer TaxID=987056 RepID=UPI00118528C3|nr:molybdopterin cofactor-binding domain-containing protein [Rhodoligotrophos appendicifer]
MTDFNQPAPGVLVGRSVRRKEDHRFITGAGRFVDDLVVPGVAHARFLRSPHAHAEIGAIDIRAALAMPGVLAVYTGRDLKQAGIGSLPCGWQLKDRAGNPMAEPPHFVLATDKARHVGEPVAVVIAETAAAAQDAIEAVSVDYRVHEAVADVARAILPEAPRVWDEVKGNLCCDWEIGDSSAVAEAIAGAAHVTRIELINNRLAPVPMEGRAALARYDAGTGLFTLHTTSQNPHTARSIICALLGISDGDMRVISPDVGGGFGGKIPVYPEEVCLCWAARQLNRAVRWTSDRTEAFLTDVHGRDHKTWAELALDRDGTFLGLRVRTLANVGAYLSLGGSAIPTFYYAPLLSGVYRLPAIYCNVELVFTHTSRIDAYRGAGRPEATYLLERLVDQAAHELGMDRIALRRRNFIPREAFPYETPVGLTYDSGDHEATLDLALEAADWQGASRRRAEASARGMLHGIGLSTYVEIAGGMPSHQAASLGARGGRSEIAQIRVNPGGSVTVFSGAHSHGQGHETTFAQIVSDRLGIPIESVRIVQGDTDRIPFGRGTAASRSLVLAGSAIIRALAKIEVKLQAIAAHLLEAPTSELSFSEGVFRIAGTNRSVTVKEVAAAAYSLRSYPPGLEAGLDETAAYDPANWTYPGGCHVCELEIDPETGEMKILRIVAVDDVGHIINPMVVEGQIHGALAQGFGQAVTEHCVFDDAGQMLTASLQDYAVPRADDLPDFTVLTHATACEHNPLKAKGCAEVGTVGLPPAIVNAALDAVRPLGITTLDMPLTPDRLWRAIASSR